MTIWIYFGTTNSTLNKLEKAFSKKIESLKNNRTSTLWIQYMTTVQIVCRFLRSERLGNWDVHLSTLHEMLPYFAACGHNNYTKSIYIYLKKISELADIDPSLQERYVENGHVMRRNNVNVWGGISNDQIIEQTLMRSLKSCGGLTHGRDFNQVQRNLFVFSRPMCAQINEVFENMKNASFKQSCQQSKEIGASRIARDTVDCQKVEDFLKEHNPFSQHSKSLRNIVSGVVAGKSVNVENAVEVGRGILADMEGKVVSEYSFKKSNQVINMVQKIQLKTKDGDIDIDPNLLFQRLTAILLSSRKNNIDISLDNIFSYSLCPYPASLAASSRKMLTQTSKADILTSFKETCKVQNIIQSNTVHVIDGGYLMHAIVKWKKNSTFGQIAKSTCQSIIKDYPRCVVVFDGYPDGPTTKDATHRARTEISGIGYDVDVTARSCLTQSKEKFLANRKN